MRATIAKMPHHAKQTHAFTMVCAKMETVALLVSVLTVIQVQDAKKTRTVTIIHA